MSAPLPSETLTTIFEELESVDIIQDHVTRSDIFNCSLVSRSWRSAALPLLWETILIPFGDAVEEPDAKYGYKASYLEQLANSLNLEREKMGQDHVDRISYIRNYRLSATYGKNEPMHDNTATSVHCITKLIRPSQIECMGFLLYNCDGIIYPRESYVNIWRAIFPELSQNIKALVFSDSGDKLETIIGRNRGAFPFSEDDIILNNLPKSLHNLILNGEYLNTQQTTAEANYDGIFTLPKLRSLELLNLHMTADPLEQGVQTWHPYFEWLHIDQCAALCRSSVVLALSNHCHNLRTLTLKYWNHPGPPPDISEDSLCHLIDSCPHLAILQLVYVTNLTNRFLAHCAAYACKLVGFEIEQTGIQLTGEGVVDMNGWKNSLDFLFVQRDDEGDEPTEMDPAFVENVRTQCKRLNIYYIGNYSNIEIE